MNDEFRCDIVSAHTEIFSGEVAMVVAPGVSGDLGIYPRHAPLMTMLRPGPVRVILPGGEENVFFAGGGVLEVMPHLVTVLADTAVRAADIDEAAAVRARDDAERTMREKVAGFEFAEAELQLKKALAELRAVEAFRRRTRYKAPGEKG